ncbi:MAG: NTP transferase domain-containing protein [Halodesulfurarchaeum sp.]|nr:NTP transferase domain-containing protein [Halodesulfurarchaeum sp.]
MCGGQGSRLEFEGEKPQYEIAGQPMIDRVIDALEASTVDQVSAVGSPQVPETRAHVDIPVIEGTGDGYVADLSLALEQVEQPVLTLGADLPLLDGPAIDWVLDAYDTGSAMVAVPVERKTELGVSIDSTSEYQGTIVTPTGVNVVGDPEPEDTLMTTDPKFAVNVNRPRDAWIATVLAGSNGPR